jgi:hypothetical protein
MCKATKCNKVLLKGSSITTNQEDDKDGGGDHIEDEQTLEPNNNEEEEQKHEEDGEEANVKINAPSSKNWKFATLGKQIEHASAKFKAHKLASPSRKSVATLVLGSRRKQGLARLWAKRKPGSEGKCEGMNLHTP